MWTTIAFMCGAFFVGVVAGFFVGLRVADNAVTNSIRRW